VAKGIAIKVRNILKLIFRNTIFNPVINENRKRVTLI